MSNRVLSLITQNKRKQQFYEQAIRFIKADVRLVIQDFFVPEIQSLQEIETLQYKITQAIKVFNPPFVLDHEGFYLDGLPAFPGTLTKFVIQGMGWDALLEFSKNKKVTFFCNLAFVDSLGHAVTFSKSTEGILIPAVKAPTMANNLADFFIPSGQTMTLTQLEAAPDVLTFFPRFKAIKELLNSKAFENEFKRTKNTVFAKDY